jgi:hypothetical protein
MMNIFSAFPFVCWDIHVYRYVCVCAYTYCVYIRMYSHYDSHTLHTHHSVYIRMYSLTHYTHMVHIQRI